MPKCLGYVAALVLGIASAAQAGHVTAELVGDKTAVIPGGKMTLALNLKLDKGWHVYWMNPGDTGLPPRVKWTLPPGVKAGPLRFPTPHRIDAGDGVIAFGYQDAVALLVDLEIPAGAKGALNIAGDAKWVVCADACVAEKQTVGIAIPVGPVQPNNAQQFKTWQAQQPDRTNVQPVAATLDADAKHGTIEVPIEAGETPVDFFPPLTPFAVYDRPQVVPIGASGKGGVYRMPFRVLPEAPSEYSATGLIVVRKGGNIVSRERVFTFKFPVH